MCEQGSKLKQIRLAHTTKSLKTHALVDPCIARIIQMFNDEGYQTVVSCCGHGVRPGVITLENGTELILCYTYKQTRMVETLYPGLHEEIDGKTPLPLNVDDYEALVNELEEDNAELMKDRDSQKTGRYANAKIVDTLIKDNAGLTEARDRCARHVRQEEIKSEKLEKENADLDSDRGALIYDRNHLKDRISELITDRDGQKAGWDASVKVIDKFILELDNQRKENDDLTKTIDVLRDGHTQGELNDIEDYKKNIIMLQGMFNDVKAERDSLRVTISALRTASKFKKEYDPKWQNEVKRLEAIRTDHILHSKRLSDEINRLKKEPERIHGHWHKQTSGYMNKIKNQRRQLKEYQKHSHRLTERMNTLFPYIAHGGKDHREWLRNAIDRHFDMSRPDLKPKLGMETKTFNQGGFFKEGDI